MAKSSGQGKDAFLAKAGKFKKSFKEARKVDPGQSFSNPELPDGSYTCRLSGVNMGVSEKTQAPYVSFQFKIVKGKFKGESPSVFHNLKDESKLEWLVKDCKRLLPEIDEKEWGGIELEDLIEKLEEIGNPYVKLDVKNKEYKAQTGPNKGKMVNGMNVYVGKVLEDYEEEDETDDEEETTDEEETSDEEETDEDGDAETEEEAGDPDPEKGSVVLFKAPKSRKATEYTVIKANPKTRQADIRNDEGVKHTGISFDELTLVFEDDE